jgi:hypothetical protein
MKIHTEENIVKEKHMESVAENLRVFGINTQPMGMSWGVSFTKPKV